MSVVRESEMDTDDERMLLPELQPQELASGQKAALNPPWAPQPAIQETAEWMSTGPPHR